LINALIQAVIHYELLLFPDERHMPRSLEGRVYMEQRVQQFFKQALLEQSGS
jgi:dipeptidyl-peptidase-4